MEYSSYRRVESKACPGVSFTVKKMSWARRNELREMEKVLRAEITALQDEAAPLLKALKALKAEGAALPEADDRRLRELIDQGNQIDAQELTPMRVRWALGAIEGLTYAEGGTPNVDMLLAVGPEELYGEIADQVAEELGLRPAQVQNLGSPSTSAAAVDGNPTDGGVENAGKLASITSAGAPNTTDPASANATDTASQP